MKTKHFDSFHLVCEFIDTLVDDAVFKIGTVDNGYLVHYLTNKPESLAVESLQVNEEYTFIDHENEQTNTIRVVLDRNEERIYFLFNDGEIHDPVNIVIDYTITDKA